MILRSLSRQLYVSTIRIAVFKVNYSSGRSNCLSMVVVPFLRTRNLICMGELPLVW
jgi:hypothetical protein